MPLENLKKTIDFTSAEKKLISSFDIPADAFIPLLLSLRDGGDWSYSAENIKTIAVIDKTTVYDDEKKLGYSLEEIYLFINPVLKDEEGTVHRLKKEIKVEELAERELVFYGSTAYDIAHEIEHLKKKEIKGESLWGFKFLK
jgi:predicted metalloprotease